MVALIYLILAVVAAPLLFFVLTWTAVTAYRVLFPEQPLPFKKDPIVIREQKTAAGDLVPVGVREIREDQRAYRVHHLDKVPYHYEDGHSIGVPQAWLDDIEMRRN